MFVKNLNLGADPNLGDFTLVRVFLDREHLFFY